MIDEEKTFEMFGYYSNSLTHGSNKKIIAICNGCKKERILRFQDYKKLCKSCVKSGKNNPMYGKIFSEEHKRKISKSEMGKVVSKEARQKMSKSKSGKNHPQYGKIGKECHNWNPNLTNEDRQQTRKYPEYIEWRTAVFERDNFTCQICEDNKGGNLIAHHLESYAVNPELRTVLENGKTICKKCHDNFHHKYRYRNNTKGQYIDFLKNSTKNIVNKL